MIAVASMPRRTPALLASVAVLVDRRLHDARFGVDAVAEALRLSPRHLRRRFVALAGQTPRAFLRQRRIKRARALLADDALSVADVAQAVGYADASAFGRAFRAVTGVAPREARLAADMAVELPAGMSDSAQSGPIRFTC